jgi:hypothetical protein
MLFIKSYETSWVQVTMFHINKLVSGTSPSFFSFYSRQHFRWARPYAHIEFLIQIIIFLFNNARWQRLSLGLSYQKRLLPYKTLWFNILYKFHSLFSIHDYIYKIIIIINEFFIICDWLFTWCLQSIEKYKKTCALYKVS